MDWTRDDAATHTSRVAQFNRVAESEFLLDHFFDLNPMLRNRITNYASQGVPLLPDLAASLDLRYRMRLLDQTAFYIANTEDFDWMSETTQMVSVVVRGHALRYLRSNFANHKDLENKIVRFIREQAQSANYYSDSYSPVSNTVIYSLVLVFGAKRVEEVIDAWRTLADHHNYIDFVAVVDAWDEVRDYPIEWAVQVVRGSAIPGVIR